MPYDPNAVLRGSGRYLGPGQSLGDPTAGYEWMQRPGSGQGQYGGLPIYEQVRAPVAAAATPATTTGTGNVGAPSLPDYSQIDDIINQINATNQQAQTSALNSRIPGAEQLQQDSSRNISGFLNPPEQYGEIDVPAASSAVASGTVGSPFAGVTGLNLTRTQRQADMIRGEQLLTGALARNPAAPITDPAQILQLLTQLQEAQRGREFQAGQTAEERRFQAEQAALQRSLQAQLGLLGSQRYAPSGGSYGPRLPTQYGRPGAPTSSTNIPADTTRPGSPLRSRSKRMRRRRE